jgi:hypothetical protein
MYLNLGRKRFALKKIQPWNSVKVTFDIPKDAADRLRLLAIEGNLHLIELGILSVEIIGQSNPIVINNKPSTTTNSMFFLFILLIKISFLLISGASSSFPDHQINSWSGYKMKINGVPYYSSKQ